MSTNRVVVVDEAWRSGGFGAEIASSIQESAFDDLDGPVGRVGAIEVTAPYNVTLEALALPNPARHVRKAGQHYGI